MAERAAQVEPEPSSRRGWCGRHGTATRGVQCKQLPADVDIMRVMDARVEQTPFSS
jgi:hypothetical protein